MRSRPRCLALRLAALLARRWRATGRPELAAWTAALFAYAVASAALTWGAAAGWDSRAFRVYYLFGGLLTAPLLGVGSLLLYGWRRVAAPALVYVGLAVGIAISMPVHGAFGDSIPAAQDHLDLIPGQARGDRGEHRGDVGRRSCRNRHDQAPATGQRADPGGGCCCRPGHRSIRLGCSENGDFRCNCSTSSLRRFYSLRPQSALTPASFPGLTRLTSTTGPAEGLPGHCGIPSGEHAGPSTRGSLAPKKPAAFACARFHSPGPRRPDRDAAGGRSREEGRPCSLLPTRASSSRSVTTAAPRGTGSR